MAARDEFAHHRQSRAEVAEARKAEEGDVCGRWFIHDLILGTGFKGFA
jgi:hypothetical protein